MERPFNVLFLCTGNTARSSIAEALMNRLGEERFRAYSAGSSPKGEANPHAIRVVESLGSRASDFRSNSWDEFAGPDAPALDFVFTVCDGAAGEVCPVWPRRPATAHWGVPDPAAATGTEAEVALAFAEAARRLRTRVEAFVALPLDKLDRAALQARLRQIGETADAPGA